MTRREPVTRRHLIARAAALTIATSVASVAAPPPADAFSPTSPICSASPLTNGPASGACALAGEGSGIASSATTALVLTPIVAWVVGGARFVLHETEQVVAQTTTPQLTSSWFSSTYWRVAGIAAVLTLPFLFAAAVQALLRSDLGLVLRAALGYLPLAALAVTIAAPLTMLLLAASDELSAIVSSAAGNQSAQFLDRATSILGAIGLTTTSPFVLFLVALLTVGGAVALWIELLVREAAVYVIVLMLPLAFAAFVWPARRVWAIRAVELLVALILSKFAIIAVLALGGAALGHASSGSVTALLAGTVLLGLAVLAPWALLRLIPLTEVASAAAGSLGSGSHAVLRHFQRADAWASEADHWVSKIAQMRHGADEAEGRSSVRATKENADANAGVAQSPPSSGGGPSGEPGGSPAEAPAAGGGATTNGAAAESAAAAANRGAQPDGAAANAEAANAEVAATHAETVSSSPLASPAESAAMDLENPPGVLEDSRIEDSPSGEIAVGAGDGEITDRTPPPQPPEDPVSSSAPPEDQP